MLRFYHCKRQWKYCLLLQLSKLPHHMFISRQICFVALANFSMELWKYWKYWKELDHLVLFELIEQKWLVLNSSRRPKYWMATTLHPVDCQHTHCIRSSRHTWTSTWSQVPERSGNLDVHVMFQVIFICTNTGELNRWSRKYPPKFQVNRSYIV